MTIRWDDKKAEQNEMKHGVSFQEAATVLGHGLTFCNLNDHPDGNRFEYIGYSALERVLYVVTCEETDDEIRIISAREATKQERETYEEGI